MRAFWIFFAAELLAACFGAFWAWLEAAGNGAVLLAATLPSALGCLSLAATGRRRRGRRGRRVRGAMRDAQIGR